MRTEISAQAVKKISDDLCKACAKLLIGAFVFPQQFVEIYKPMSACSLSSHGSART